jgi:hypothetical protein
MQERNLTELMNAAFKHSLDNPEVVKEKMELLSIRNREDLSNIKLPDYLRLPSANELTEMRQWAIDYKKLNKHASKREIRKATQKYFNIKVYR